LWRLVEHDIWFLWERIDFLLQDDVKALLEVPLKVFEIEFNRYSIITNDFF